METSPERDFFCSAADLPLVIEALGKFAAILNVLVNGLDPSAYDLPLASLRRMSRILELFTKISHRNGMPSPLELVEELAQAKRGDEAMRKKAEGSCVALIHFWMTIAMQPAGNAFARLLPK